MAFLEEYGYLITMHIYPSTMKKLILTISNIFFFFQQQTTDTERKLAAMGISSSADYAGIKDDFDEPEYSSQVIAPARARTPSPSFQSNALPPSYDSVTKQKKVQL